MRAVIIPSLELGSIGLRRESLVNLDGPMAMVPWFHQGNIYTKRKLWVWRDQKCIPLVSAITPLNCAGRHNTPSRGRQYRAQYGKLGKLGRTYLHGTLFAPRKYLYQKEATGMETPEMYSVMDIIISMIPLVGAITLLNCAGRHITPSRGRKYRAQYGKFGKLGRTYGPDTVFAPRKYLYQN